MPEEKKYVMRIETITNGGFADVKPGAYRATFQGFEEKENSEKRSDDDDRFFKLWHFKGEDGTAYSGTCGVKPTKGNKFGRWLCGLAGRPLFVGDVDPNAYIGRPYMLIFAENKNGKVALNTITPMT